MSEIVYVGLGKVSIRYVLTLADQQIANSVIEDRSGDTSNRELLELLSKTPLARVERKKLTWIADAVHLNWFANTMYCQWYGRASNGAYYPIGDIMRIVEIL